ncbi:hypothetical protein [Streptomyces minutiscleroticus]|uniref:hypothetical protein n=1 Tax=Streptomyces minutiscleroticus TaxID=68238 RepID=UPI001E301975|nr:hypothetical protein [Streptomyces minutiscleroticus]
MNTATTGLPGEYLARVNTDLEDNAREQERVTAEIAALQERLTALQHERSVLVNVQQALGVTAPVTPASPSRDTAPVPGRRTAVSSEPGEQAGQDRTAVENGKPVKKKVSRKTSASATAPRASQPTLVELARLHLAEHKEPRSAAEITAALAQAHPDRGIKATVVRTTLEGLVARSRVQRTRQGRSVFYSIHEA